MLLFLSSIYKRENDKYDKASEQQIDDKFKSCTG